MNSPSILFVLPSSGGGGGAHSVMQEADAMRAFGIDAKIAVNHDNADRLQRNYRDLTRVANQIFPYQKEAGLGELIKTHAPDMVVATTNQSVHVVADALKVAEIRDQKTAYYIQDYEPFFYERGSNDWFLAYSSYGLIPGMIHFAKTRWLQEVVEENHGVQVAKVDPSVDHRVFYPEFGLRRSDSQTLRIVAMLRPATPRRAPRRTVRILNRIVAEMKDKVACSSFGCSAADLEVHSLKLRGVEHLDVLSREDVGYLFRRSDLLLDLSDFQAFGRSAIEAMSCGAVALVPAHGGAYEFAVDGRTGFVVDTRSDDAIMSAVYQFTAMTPAERHEMMMQGIETGFGYSPERAALSEIKALGLAAP